MLRCMGFTKCGAELGAGSLLACMNNALGALKRTDCSITGGMPWMSLL